MPKPSSHLSDYYAELKHAVGHDILDARRFRAHERKRQNLLEHHLKLPLAVWRGARVLEFGPGSGENAVVLARHGARLTLVEPLDYLVESLRANFAAHGVADKIEAVHMAVIEGFRSEKRYDAVFSEGFLHFLDDPCRALAQMAKYMAPEGFLVLQICNPSGTFVEYLKKAFLELEINALGAVSIEDKMVLAAGLFEDQYKKINYSRTFKSWVEDCLNPDYRPVRFPDFADLLAALPADVQLYSSWPNYRNEDDLVWHKNIKNAARMRRECLDGYFARYPHFLHSIPQDEPLPLFKPAEGRALKREVTRALAGLDKLLLAKSPIAADYASCLKPFARALRGYPQGRQAAEVIESAGRLFASVSGKRSPKDYERAWKRAKLLRNTWGSPGHNYAFHKTRLYEA